MIVVDMKFSFLSNKVPTEKVEGWNFPALPEFRWFSMALAATPRPGD